MIKNVIYDYIRSFRWKNIKQLDKERNNFSFYWTICYFAFFYPVITRLYQETAFTIANYFLWMIQFCIGILGIQLLPIRLKKIIFLSPLDKQERRKYSYSILLVRIMIPLVIQGVLGIVFCVFGVINLMSILVQGISVLTLFMLVSVKVYGKGDIREKKTEKQYYDLIFILSMMFGIVGQMANCMFLEDILNGGKIGGYVLLGEMIIFLLIIFWCIRSIPDFIERNCNYTNEDWKIMQNSQSERER